MDWIDAGTVRLLGSYHESLVPAMVRALLRKLLTELHLYGLYSLYVKGPLHDDGWFRSFNEGRSVDKDGNPVPFITYPAIEFLSGRIHPEMSVFEFGSGSSTLWWASRVREVVACEHDPKWFLEIRSQARENVSVIHHPLEYGGAYSNAILNFKDRFDIVVVDGRDRVNCAKNCLGALKLDGVVLWDNSDRTKYEEGYRFLGDRGFRRLDFVGMCPIINERSQTSIFYRRENCLGI